MRSYLKPKFRSPLSLAMLTTVSFASLVACSAADQGEATGQVEAGLAALEASALLEPGVIHPEIWPVAKSPIAVDPAIEAKIIQLLGQMSLEEKVGQIIQADIGSITPEQVREYNLGSVLNGGNSAPGGDNHTTPQAWLDLADEFWVQSTDTSGGRTAVPVMWGTDAVHGHNNIVGATVFPHNIGLGATNNPDLMEQIGNVTAREIRVTGLDWTFAPTIAVVRNDRWGRTYESYSEAPDIVANFTPRLVYGLQGHPDDKDFLKGEHLMSTVKHFVGDGGTQDGIDQGENLMTETQLRDLQAAGYPAAVEAGIQSVMASFNSWHGKKLHGHKGLLTDVLRERFGFDGLVVGDWNGHGQVVGCTKDSCAQSVNAGVDLFMAPDSWKELYANTLTQAKSGEITMERLDEAVARILRVKLRSGIFEAGLPSQRAIAGQWELLGADAHMNIARQAVRESLVLLKNENNILPIKAGAVVLITGEGADDVGKQSGGWTINWQGTGNTDADFPNGVSIYEGLKDAIEAAGGTAIFADDISGKVPKVDVAVVIYGEDPYAEFVGDREHVDFVPTDSLEQLTALKAAGVPTVSVFLSGRPMWVNPELNQSDAFVAAWLPGTAGDGVAEVLVADASGKTAHDFKGKLSFSWPKSSYDVELNVGDENYDPLFAYGYGLSYADDAVVPVLSEAPDLAGRQKLQIGSLMLDGVVRQPWMTYVMDAKGSGLVLDTGVGTSTQGGVTVTSMDDAAQEDMRLIEFNGAGTFALVTNQIDLERESNGEMAVSFTYRVNAGGQGTQFGGACEGETCRGMLDLGDQFAAKAGQGWQTATIKLLCLAEAGVDMKELTSPFVVSANEGFSLGLKEVALVTNTGEASCEL